MIPIRKYSYPPEITVAEAYFHGGNGSKTSTVVLPVSEGSSGLLLPHAVSCIIRCTVRLENTYFCILKLTY